ncbi:MAG: flagellar motor protein MotD [Methylophaga sp.]|nr:flagellar motor protein MotD [Methylophaga sp.]
MARRRKDKEHINHDRWLVSYADFITLLFAFFVVMYSISSVNDGKYRVLSDTLEATFTDSVKSLNPIQEGKISRGHGEKTPENLSAEQSQNMIELPVIEIFTPPPVSEETIQTINDISQKLNNSLKDLIENEDVIIKQGEDWLELEMKSNVLFYSGEARLEKAAVPIIGKVADILRSSSNTIQVEGFTDNNPINTSRFPSNWELSAARAASVVHLLDRYGLEPSRMSAIGYGEFKPIADNLTEQGRQKNRRVVLVVLGSNENRRVIDVFTPPNETPSEPIQEESGLTSPGPKAINQPRSQPIQIKRVIRNEP